VAALAAAAVSCSGLADGRDDPGDTMTTSTPLPEGWQRIELDDAVSLALPPDAVAQSVQPIDSIFGILRGEGYEVVYDYGRSGDDFSLYADEAGFSRRSRDVEGRRATEVSFRGQGDPWTDVRILQVRDGRNVLTVRMSCTDEETCRAADVLFDSVRFGPD
jgi:hypothetical protein